MTSPQSKGQLFGIGVGPGDPDLLTLKALKLLKSAPVIAYICSRPGHSMALGIVQAHLNEMPEKIQIAIPMPMSLDRSAANSAYDKGCQQIADRLDDGDDVIFLCEGDPMTFGSYVYVHDRLSERYGCRIVPGISSIQASSAVAAKPLAMQDESFKVISGRLSDDAIKKALQEEQHLAILKAGQSRPRILRLLAETGRLTEAQYIERATLVDEHITTDLNDLDPDSSGPYFSLFLVHTNRLTR